MELGIRTTNFSVEGHVLGALGILSQAKKLKIGITSNGATISVIFQAHIFRAKIFATLIKKPRRTANSIRCASEKSFFLRLYQIARHSRLGVNCTRRQIAFPVKAGGAHPPRRAGSMTRPTTTGKVGRAVLCAPNRVERPEGGPSPLRTSGAK